MRGAKRTSMTDPSAPSRHPASFRDPSGYVFSLSEGAVVYRRIQPVYFEHYRQLMTGGLYDTLTSKGLLIPHEEVEESPDKVVIKPEQLEFISYPYEWSFEQLKAAALATLRIAHHALKHGMILKDGTAFNIQFLKSRPVFIDTLSFDTYREGTPWYAYGQFVRHFLAPLLMMKYVSSDTGKLSAQYLDGIPLEVIAASLPVRARLSPFLWSNIFLHNRAHQKLQKQTKDAKVSKKLLFAILQNLFEHIKDLRMSHATEWGDYGSEVNYTTEAMEAKESIVRGWIEHNGYRRVWDVGGNEGRFSRAIHDLAEFILCSDIDNVAVSKCYRMSLETRNIYALMADVTAPSPGIGHMNRERSSLLERVRGARFDCTVALALIHHLSLTANLPFDMTAELFASTARNLIIEFVPPGDSWVDMLLDTKREAKGLFSHYNQEEFEAVYSKYFHEREKAEIPGSRRILYRLETR